MNQQKGEKMKKKSLFLIILFVLILSVLLIAATKNQDPRLDKKTLSNSRSSSNEVISVKRTYEGPIYKKSNRQVEVLFVEDPGMPGFGTATKPDPQWIHYLDITLGSGNYDWWGPVVDSSDGPPVDTMALYDLVIWNCYDWWWSPCFAPTSGAVANMSTYMDGGGKVWFIGQDANYSFGPSFLTTFLTPYFEVQSVTDDVIWATYTVACQGENVLAGFAYGDSADFASNPFFPDEVIPTANGQQIIWDGQYHFNVITNDFRSSFWTVDGRICTPDSEFVAVVDSMLNLFSIGVAVEEKPITQDPKSFSLTAKTSNPTKGHTSISYSTAQNGKVSLKVYDGTGKLVRKLVDNVLEQAGTKTLYWDGKNDNHHPVAAGVYFIRLSMEGRTATKKMVIVR